MRINKMPVINEGIIAKLETIALDLKYYINVNYAMSKSTEDFPEYSSVKCMDEDDLNEFLEIRSRIKKLNSKLKSKLNS